MNRKEKIKKRLLARRKFYDTLHRLEKESRLAEKRKLRLEPNTFRVTFTFGPSELNIECFPTQENIEKFGLQRALERLDRRDFFTNVALIARGKPTAENIARIRTEVLENTKTKMKKDGNLDLSAFTTTAGEFSEVNS
jgi:hypothetical protein